MLNAQGGGILHPSKPSQQIPLHFASGRVGVVSLIVSAACGSWKSNLRSEIFQADRQEAISNISGETSDEATFVGKTAVTRVPPLPDSISRCPPNCRTLSLIP
jgi:hypothetical protein